MTDDSCDVMVILCSVHSECYGYLKLKTVFLLLLVFVASIIVYQSLYKGYDTAYRSCDSMVTLNSLYLGILCYSYDHGNIRLLYNHVLDFLL